MFSSAAAPDLKSYDLARLQSEFQKLDPMNTGEVPAEELGKLLQATNPELSSKDIEDIITAVDEDNSGTISYTEVSPYDFPLSLLHLPASVFWLSRVFRHHACHTWLYTITQNYYDRQRNILVQRRVHSSSCAASDRAFRRLNSLVSWEIISR